MIWLGLVWLLGTAERRVLSEPQKGLPLFGDGFDVVAFLETGMFERGSTTFEASHSSLIYRFKNQNNLDIFLSAPQKYNQNGLSEFLEAKPFYYVDEDGVGLAGFDVVAYFTLGTPQKGKPAHSFENDGIVYYFGSERHLALFQSDPDKYLPQFGGWCAWGVSLIPVSHSFPPGRYAPDPTQFLVKEGRLYLFQENGWVSGKISWLRDEPSAVKRGYLFWQKMMD